MSLSREDEEYIFKRMVYLREMIFKKMGDHLKCIYCGNEDYDIIKAWADKDDVSKFDDECLISSEPNYVPALVLICSDCGKRRVMRVDIEDNNPKYVD